jgi:hypothetical protein
MSMLIVTMGKMPLHEKVREQHKRKKSQVHKHFNILEAP